MTETPVPRETIEAFDSEFEDGPRFALTIDPQDKTTGTHWVLRQEAHHVGGLLG